MCRRSWYTLDSSVLAGPRHSRDPGAPGILRSTYRARGPDFPPPMAGNSDLGPCEYLLNLKLRDGLFGIRFGAPDHLLRICVKGLHCDTTTATLSGG